MLLRNLGLKTGCRCSYQNLWIDKSLVNIFPMLDCFFGELRKVPLATPPWTTWASYLAESYSSSPTWKWLLSYHQMYTELMIFPPGVQIYTVIQLETCQIPLHPHYPLHSHHIPKKNWGVPKNWMSPRTNHPCPQCNIPSRFPPWYFCTFQYILRCSWYFPP